MECRQAELFKVLSVTSRIKIIELLKEKGPLGVKDIAELLGITASAVSQHLKILRYVGLVRNERKGYTLPYEINHTAMAQCKEIIAEVCDCGCKESCREQVKNDADLAVLSKRRKELQKELERIEENINRIKIT